MMDSRKRIKDLRRITGGIAGSAILLAGQATGSSWNRAARAAESV